MNNLGSLRPYEDLLIQQVESRIRQANRPAQIAVTKHEHQACEEILRAHYGTVPRSVRKHILFHNVELIPE